MQKETCSALQKHKTWLELQKSNHNLIKIIEEKRPLIDISWKNRIMTALRTVNEDGGCPQALTVGGNIDYVIIEKNDNFNSVLLKILEKIS